MANYQFLKQVIIKQIEDKITDCYLYSNEKLKPEWLVDFTQKELRKIVTKFNKINQETITFDEFNMATILELFQYYIENNITLSPKEQNLLVTVLNEEVEIYDYEEISVYEEYP